MLVLDEPMAGLDPAARKDFLQLIGRLHREGLTVVMVSHSMDDLAQCCDRVVVMNEGAVFAEGAPPRCLLAPKSSSQSAWAFPPRSEWRWRWPGAGVPLRLDRLYTVESLADELATLLSSGSRELAHAPSASARKEDC